jgi:hypothetical protein
MSLIRNSLVGGTLTALASTLAATLLARAEGKPPAAAMNAVSHWLWGARAARQDDLSARYTLTGTVTNHAACVLWAGVYELLQQRLPRTRAHALAAGPAVAALAYVVDYHVVPRRLTPGYELRLGKRSLAVLYGVIALSLPLRALLQSRTAPLTRSATESSTS